MSYKVLTAEFMHESNTFSRIETDQQAFRNRYFLTGAGSYGDATRSPARYSRSMQNSMILKFPCPGS